MTVVIKLQLLYTCMRFARLASNEHAHMPCTATRTRTRTHTHTLCRRHQAVAFFQAARSAVQVGHKDETMQVQMPMTPHARTHCLSLCRRQEAVASFQAAGSAAQVALLSIAAAGTGLTLTRADVVVFAELYWNPSHLMQVGAGGGEGTRCWSCSQPSAQADLRAEDRAVTMHCISIHGATSH